MPEFARVISIDALRDFKAALADFAEEAGLALSEAQSDVQRTIFWLQNDRAAFWQREIKKRNERLAQAKAELHKAQLASNDMRTSAILERKAVAAAQARLDEAEQKLRNVKKWNTHLEREFLLFKAQCQQVSTAVQGDMPVAIARMNRMIESLQQYIAIQAPQTDLLPSAFASTTAVESTGEILPQRASTQVTETNQGGGAEGGSS
jgi:predicted  nucleic acid-binding Zn-ribbon protein